jgi:nitrogen fixation/metabolism regulation signal transduction histidine kinase
MFYLSIKTLDKFSKLNMESSKIAIANVTEENCRMSENILADYSKKIIKIEARSLARELAHIINSMKKPYTYFDLRANSRLKALATRNIYSLSHRVGYFTVIDRKGESILHARDSHEAQKIREMEDKYPAMWESLQDSFRKKELVDEITVKNKNNEAIKKFLVAINIENTPFNLCAVVDLDSIIKEVSGKIRQAGNEAERSSEELRRTVLSKMKSHYVKISGVYTALILIFGIIYGLLFGNYICKPIAKLQEAIKDLQQGKIPENLKEEGSSETKEVTQSFNDMTTMLRREDVQAAFRRARAKDAYGKQTPEN